MTLGEAIQAAKNGDANAMMTLGRYYRDQHENMKALEYFEQAGEEGVGNGMLISMTMRQILADTHRDLRNFEDAIKNYEKTYYWCRYILNISKTSDADLFSEADYDKAYECAVSALFNGGVSYFFLEKHQDGLDATMGLETPKMKMLHGIHLFMSSNDLDGLRQAVQEMHVIETSGFYVPSENDYFSDNMIATAAESLALVYREGLFGPSNMENSVRILTNTRDMIQDQSQKQRLQKELSRYQKKLLGGYTYIG